MRIAVIVHVYYPELWDELAQCIANFKHEEVDIFVTTSVTDPVVEKRVLARFPKSHFRVVENRGYDVAPFISVLDSLNLDSYDYVVKIHTKRNVDAWIKFRKWKGSAWRNELLSFCRTEKDVRLALSRMSTRRRLGMIAGGGLIDQSGVASCASFEGTDELLKELGLSTRSRVAVHGTMFMVRACLLKPLQGKIDQERFLPITEQNCHTDLGMAVTLEGSFARMVVAQGYYVGTGLLPDWLAPLAAKIQAFGYSSMRYISNLARTCLSA